MVQHSLTFTGSALLLELGLSDKMTAAAATSWIVRKTGHGFDPEAMYELRWQSEEDSPTWSGYVDMHVHIMTDSELVQMEREVRRRDKQPQRRPWEAPMFKSAMGRSDGPRREPRTEGPRTERPRA